MTGTEFEHIERSTPDLTEENIDKVAALFPDVVTEVENPDGGAVTKAIDFDALKAKLGDVAEGARERYQFTWPGKRAAKAEARTPITKTMRPVPERSKDWDTTQNLYIEGDNLDALKILRETYAGKVKLIYIDPPYNTGHDFIYKDDFHKTVAEDREDNGDFDEEGGRLVANLETNGRFHSDWCSMIYPRLILARDLLSSDGLIFISIDENELNDLLSICYEIYGQDNVVDIMIWKKRYGGGPKEKYLVTLQEYIIMIAKDINCIDSITIPLSDESIQRYYSKKDHNYKMRGGYRTHPLEGGKTLDYRPNLVFPIIAPDGSEVWPKKQWLWGRDRVQEALKNEEIEFVKSRDGSWSVQTKQYLKDDDGVIRRGKQQSIIEGIYTEQGTKEMIRLFGDAKIFPYPKPTKLLETLISMISDREGIVLDFFSGSATLANAVMEHNLKNNTKLQYILVQISEEIKDNKYNFKTICEFAENRIGRESKRIIEENPIWDKGEIGDLGFRVLRIDSSSYEDVRKTPDAYTQGNLEFDVDITKGDRTPLDLLFECLPTFRIPYSASIEQLDGEAFDGYTVYSVNHGQLVACFDEKIPERVMRGMAQLDPKPSYAVVGERSLPDSSARTNFAEIFRQSADALQGQTQIRIL